MGRWILFAVLFVLVVEIQSARWMRTRVDGKMRNSRSQLDDLEKRVSELERKQSELMRSNDELERKTRSQREKDKMIMRNNQEIAIKQAAMVAKGEALRGKDSLFRRQRGDLDERLRRFKDKDAKVDWATKQLVKKDRALMNKDMRLMAKDRVLKTTILEIAEKLGNRHGFYAYSGNQSLGIGEQISFENVVTDNAGCNVGQPPTEPCKIQKTGIYLIQIDVTDDDDDTEESRPEIKKNGASLNGAIGFDGEGDQVASCQVIVKCKKGDVISVTSSDNTETAAGIDGAKLSLFLINHLDD